MRAWQVGVEEAGPGEVSIAAPSEAAFPVGLGFTCGPLWTDEAASLLSPLLRPPCQWVAGPCPAPRGVFLAG